MGNRDFDVWLGDFTNCISGYDYYVNFDKVIKNVDKVKIELNILNSLVGSHNIEDDFEEIVTRYPETLKCIPLLIAVRNYQIFSQDEEGEYIYDFKNPNQSKEQYKIFMKKTGLFDLISNNIINNLVDYAFGVETGLDSNGRKNRGGHQMENLVEKYIISSGFEKDVDYFKEMYLSDIEARWDVDLSTISNKGKTEKRFDFVIKTNSNIYGIETNFYSSGGSKLNETARSYKMIAKESEFIEGFKFVWFTDGQGWKTARGNLRETFEVMEHIYNIKELKNDIIEKELL